MCGTIAKIVEQSTRYNIYIYLHIYIVKYSCTDSSLPRTHYTLNFNYTIGASVALQIEIRELTAPALSQFLTREMKDLREPQEFMSGSLF